MIERLAPHVPFDVDPKHVAPISHDHVESGVRHIKRKKPCGGNTDQRPVLPGKEIVDKKLDSDWKDKL